MNKTYEELCQQFAAEQIIRDGYAGIATDTLSSTSRERRLASMGARAAKGRISTLLKQFQKNGWRPPPPTKSRGYR